MAVSEVCVLTTDVLVIGAGAAGCRAAIEAADRGAQVTLLIKGRLGRAGSSFYPLTQGLGFTTALPGGPEETAGVEAHYREIMAAGAGMASPTLARILAEDAPRRFLELVERFHLRFNTDESGTILYIRPDYGSGAVRAGGASIAALQATFSREVRRRSVQLVEHAAAVRLLGDAAGCRGCVAATRAGELIVIGAGATVLATGGYAGLFEHHMTTAGQLGDGYALALNLGAELVNLEYYQMILGLTAPVRGMIIPESALQSLPALTNGQGEAFLAGYLPAGLSPDACMLERAATGPFHSEGDAKYFDLALFGEMVAGRALPSGGLRCDFTGRRPDELRGLRRDWLEWALGRGLDLREKPVEIAPHVHADNGGVLINGDGATCVPGLFACGEAAGGPHGANRIGGNMMSNTQVFGARAGAAAAGYAKRASRPAPTAADAAPERERLREMGRRADGPAPRQILARVQATLYREMAVSKDAASLKRALETLDEVEREMLPALRPAPGQLSLALGLPLALQTARLVARSALLRQESRGGHYRSDFPAGDDARFGRPFVWRLGAGGPEVSERALA